MSVTTVLYTAIYEEYEHPKALPADLPSDVRAVLFTDTAATAKAARALGWTVRQRTETRPKADRAAHPTQAGMMRHKWLKTHPGAVLDLDDGDVSIWLDGSMTITADRFIERALDALGDDDAAFTPHPFHACVYDEAAFSATLERYADCRQALHDQAAHYRTIGHPARWGLFATGARVLRHNATTAALGRHWWYENVHWTWQDQVSLPVVVRIMAERDGLTWNARLPWREWWHLSEHGT